MVMISMLEAIPTSLSMILTYFVSYVSDRHGERLLYSCIGAILMAISLALTGYFIDTSFTFLYTLYVFFELGIGVALSLHKSYQIDILPKTVSAAGFALINGCGSFGGFVGEYR